MALVMYSMCLFLFYTVSDLVFSSFSLHFVFYYGTAVLSLGLIVFCLQLFSYISPCVRFPVNCYYLVAHFYLLTICLFLSCNFPQFFLYLSFFICVIVLQIYLRFLRHTLLYRNISFFRPFLLLDLFPPFQWF